MRNSLLLTYFFDVSVSALVPAIMAYQAAQAAASTPYQLSQTLFAAAAELSSASPRLLASALGFSAR